MRVFEIKRILSSPEGDLEPLHSVEPTKVPSEYGDLPGYTYAVVDDAERGRVLFAGLDGVIRSLELASGEVADLVSPPGTPPIIQMELVGGNLLFCLCQPGFPETRGKRQQPLLHIWEFTKLEN